METVCQSSQQMDLFTPPKLLKQSKPITKASCKLSTNTSNKLPSDPRQWTREQVHLWLQLISSAHNLQDVLPSRFAMNGKALCLMTPAMFVQRVPIGGKLLYRDFQLRLTIAVHAAQR